MEDKFEKIMKREGMGDLMRPIKYLAQMRYPDPEHPTILGTFRTKKARDKWYQEVGRGYEMADVGVGVEFAEAPVEDDDRFSEDIGK